MYLNFQFVFYLDQFCNPAMVSYSGFNVTWNETKAGVTAVAPCTGPRLAGEFNSRKTDITSHHY